MKRRLVRQWWPKHILEQRKKDKKVKERFKELGYTEGGTMGHYPCLCGEYPDDNPVWWMGGNFNKSGEKKTPDHLFCLRCKKRVYENDIAEAIKAWHTMKSPMATLRRAMIDDD